MNEFPCQRPCQGTWGISACNDFNVNDFCSVNGFGYAKKCVDLNPSSFVPPSYLQARPLKC